MCDLFGHMFTTLCMQRNPFFRSRNLSLCNPDTASFVVECLGTLGF